MKITDLNNLYVVIDFDKTITSEDSVNSWRILETKKQIPNTYLDEMNRMQEYYGKIELDEKVEKKEKERLMKEWWTSHLNLFITHKFTKDLFKVDNDSLKPREGLREFFEYLNKNNVPIIIISAGLTDVIEDFLKLNDLYLDNIYVNSNKIKFENDIAVGIYGNIIHSMNKNDVNLNNIIKEKITNRKQTLLIGDQISDLNMSTNPNTIKVVMLNNNTEKQIDIYKEKFDILISKEENYYTLVNKLF